jgi:hypothetical protein
VIQLQDQHGRIFHSGRADSDRCCPVNIDPVLLGFVRPARGAERQLHHSLFEDARRVNDYDVGTFWWPLVPLRLVSNQLSRLLAIDTTVCAGVVRDG